MGAFGRINYVIKPQWHVFGELSSGIDFLSANNFQDETNGMNVEYASNSTSHVFYGLAVGTTYNIYSHLNIGARLGYINYGDATLGQRNLPAGSTVSGSISQSMNTILTSIDLAYHF